MRSKNTLLNSLVTLIFQSALLVIGFFIPRFIIQVYGSEVNGFTANVGQMINLINLLQAGMVGASIFELYKPIVDEDYELIGRIYFSSEKYFKKLSKLFFLCTLLIAPYIIFFTQNSIGISEVIFSVLIIGINATYVFRYYCKYDVIFSAYQKKYELVISLGIEKLVYYMLLCFVLFMNLSFILMYVAALIGSISKVFYLENRYNKLYKSKINKYRNSPNYKVENKNKLFGNQIIQNMIELYPTVVVSVLNGLEYASVLYVYIMVVNIFKMIFSTLQNAVAASFGDLIAHGNDEKTMEIYNIIQFIFLMGCLCVYIPMAVLMLPFVKLYTSDISNSIYIYPILANSVVFYISSYTLFLPYNMFVNSKGLYGKVLKKNVLYGMFSLIVSVAMCLYDFQYIYVGGGMYYLLSIIDRYHVLRENGVKLKTKNLLPSIYVIAFVLFVSKCSNTIYVNIVSWGGWLISGVILVLLAFGIIVGLSLLLYRKEVKNLRGYVKKRSK